MTIEEKLAPYKDNEKFCECYRHCQPIENIEGEIIFNAIYSGYSLTSKDAKASWFTDFGIRGTESGDYFIKNGEPKKLIPFPSSDQMRLFRDIQQQYGFVTQNLWLKHQIE